jgi:hypothetical protein
MKLTATSNDVILRNIKPTLFPKETVILSLRGSRRLSQEKEREGVPPVLQYEGMKVNNSLIRGAGSEGWPVFGPSLKMANSLI